MHALSNTSALGGKLNSGHPLAFEILALKAYRAYAFVSVFLNRVTQAYLLFCCKLSSQLLQVRVNFLNREI